MKCKCIFIVDNLRLKTYLTVHRENAKNEWNCESNKNCLLGKKSCFCLCPCRWQCTTQRTRVTWSPTKTHHSSSPQQSEQTHTHTHKYTQSWPLTPESSLMFLNLVSICLKVLNMKPLSSSLIGFGWIDFYIDTFDQHNTVGNLEVVNDFIYL